MILIGYFILVIALFFIGPSQILGFYNSPALTILGLAIMGFGCGMVVIPILPEMIEAIEERFPELDETELHNQMSGLFIAFQGIGETSGPILGSVFNELVGFRSAQDIMALIMAATMILYFLCCGRTKMFESVGKQKDGYT